MRIKNLILSIVSLALVFSCAREGGASDPAEREPTFRIVHYSAEVSEAVTTKATVDGGNHYIFEEGDRLYVAGTGENAEKLYGFLHLITGAGATTAHFEGDLYCIDNDEEFELTSSTPVSVTLVSSNDQIHLVSGGKITDTEYPDDEFAADFAEAVSKFSHFTSSGTFGSRSFTLAQQSSFLIFDILFRTGVNAGTNVTYSVSNGANGTEFTPRSGTVQTAVSSGKVKAHFILAFPGDEITLDNATVSVTPEGDSETPFTFCTNATAMAVNNFFTISRTVGQIDFTGLTVEAINDDTLVKFNIYSVQYSTDGSDWQAFPTEGVTIDEGERLYFRQSASTVSKYTNTTSTPILQFDKDCYVYGNIMSLLSTVNDDDYTHGTGFNDQTEVFKGFFINNSHLKSHPDWNDDSSKQLLLPVQNLTTSCYYQMFKSCSALVHAPDLPAETLATTCYYEMFRACVSLTSLRCMITGATRQQLQDALNKWMAEAPSGGKTAIPTTGDFYCQKSMEGIWPYWSTANLAGIPNTWTFHYEE